MNVEKEFVIEICLLRIVVVLFLFGVSVLDNSRCDEVCTITSCCRVVCVHITRNASEWIIILSELPPLF